MSFPIADQNEGNGLPIADDVDMEAEEEEEEDEDIDFNPFLRGDSPSEASSSLSSDNEGGRCDNVGRDDHIAVSRPLEETRDYEDEEIVMQAGVHERDELSGHRIENEIASSTQEGNGFAFGKGTSNDLGKSTLDVDDEEAICRRTRARHSLANYTLEELETFLQESDDDCDPPNVDDEEEYRKFLAAVLMGGADEGNAGQGDDNVDEDEDNDADFDLEIEEALESDVDENVDYNTGNGGKLPGDASVPVTRQKKRLKESANNKKTLFGQVKLPLRPLVPYGSTAQASAFPAQGLNFATPKFLPHCSPPAYAFTTQQVGRLYCLIYEHVQLLIQIFSVSVLDPSKQEVANAVQKMIVDMIYRREEALGRRKAPYPEFFFQPPNLQSSLRSDWAPLIDNPVLSILDVAPLRIVKSFMNDVSDTVLRYRKTYNQDISYKSKTKEPLFPLPACESSSNTDEETHSAHQDSPGQVQSKKSLASTIVESTKKQSVALVPKDIARSAWRFYPLFNVALYPRKPPAPAVVNRLVFTNAEDGLLAMGLMQYNNDWAAIQNHFLPSKSTHQIFVRQKNRSTSKAPENPIKAVRRMKTSPLTIDEKARIAEGLKFFKNDWLSVWKFIVPHRDPSVLPRMWRIATGTQKTYKKSEALREKRRLYDANRRKMKASMNDCQISTEKEVDNGGDNSTGDVDGDGEAYVHEAFLADLEPGSAKNNASDTPLLSINRSSIPYSGSYDRETCASITNGSRDLQHPQYHFPQALRSASSKQIPYNLMSRHKNAGARVVKLAPDLPPVNLPPSVHVISQSSFKNYHFDLTSSACDGRVSQSARVRSSISNPGEPLNKVSETGQQDGNTHASQFGAEENTTDSDLQMHPLLFQAPENQLSSYYSNMHNSFPRSPLQADPNISGPQYSKRSGFCSSASEQREKVPSDLRTIDFHPLLQRADSGNGDSSGRPSQGNFGRLFDQSGCSMRMPGLADNQAGTSKDSTTHNERENILDLDISLCSAPDKEKTSGREHQDVEDRLLEKSLLGGASFFNNSGRCPEFSSTGNLSLQVVPPSNRCGYQCIGDLHDDSLPGIVMEQEELSDSDEEIEHVEFECEEIDDSEEDEMSSELPTGIQTKEFPFFTSKEEEIQANQSLQSRNLKKGSVAKGKKRSSDGTGKIAAASRKSRK